MSLLVRLVLLVLLAVAPAILVQVWSETRLRAAREAELREEAVDLTVRIAREVETAIQSARGVLAALAETRTMRERDTVACGSLLERLVERVPAYLMVSAIDASGRIFCSTAGTIGGDASERRFVKETLARRSFYVDGYVVGQKSGAKLLVVAVPIYDYTGEVSGVLAGGIDLGWLRKQIEAQRLPPDTALAVSDRNGRILARLPEPDRFVGTKIPDRLMAMAAARADGPATESAGLEGVVRVGAIRTVAFGGETALTVGVGLNKAVAFAELDANSLREWALIAVGASLALLAALLGGRVFVRRPVARLLDAATRWRRGDYGARAGLSDRRSELGQLGAAFDEMAAAVAARDEALRRSREEALAAARAQLAESEARYEALFRHSPESLFVARVTPDGRFVQEQANPECERLLGRSDAEMRGRELRDLLPRQAIDTALARFAECVATGAPVRYEVTLGSADAPRVRDVTLVPLRDAGGRIAKIFGSSRDVTQAKRAEQALRESETNYRRLYQRTPVMLHSIDRDGRLLDVSDFWCEKLGYARDEVLGRPISDFYTEEARRESGENYLPAFLRDGEIRGVTLKMVRKDGTVVDILLAAVAHTDAAGRFLRSFTVCTDVTELLRVQEQLRQAQKIEAIGQMTGGVAHDFNNLLTVIIGNLDLLRQSLREPKRVDALAAAALGAAERGEKLTQQLLAFARRQMLRPETANPNRLLKNFEPLMHRAAGESIELQLLLSPTLDPCRIDASQFEAAILNLVVNARDAMPEGGRITIETQNVELRGEPPEVAPGSYVLVAVADTGSGMPPDIAERAFEPFFTTKDVGKGSGLGLSQVYGFAKQSGGHLRLDSELGIGTTVKLYLPKSADAARREALDAAPEPAPTGSETVLIVDDNADVAQVAVETLQGLGYRTLVAADGEEAKAILSREESVDLLFTDIVMPRGISGRQLAAEARRRRAELGVLLTSGYSAEAADEAEELPFLRKPYRRAELAAKVREVIEATKKPSRWR